MTCDPNDPTTISNTWRQQQLEQAIARAVAAQTTPRPFHLGGRAV